MRKVAGEENPADLFTKHLESAAKLKQLMGLFNCQFMQGRAFSAPSLKRAATAEHMVVIAQLPHLMTKRAMDNKYPTVHPVNDTYGEEDIQVQDELGDPVPRLLRGAAKRTRTGGARAGGYAYPVTDPHRLDDVRSEPRGAGAVGRCLDRQSRCKDIVQQGERPRPSRTAATADAAAATADRRLRPRVQRPRPIGQRLRPIVADSSLAANRCYPQLLPDKALTPFKFCRSLKDGAPDRTHKRACS